MPTTPPPSTRDSVAQRSAAHARTAWPQLTDLHICHHGACAYIDGGTGRRRDPQAHAPALCRLGRQLGLRPVLRQLRPLRGLHPAHRRLRRYPRGCPRLRQPAPPHSPRRLTPQTRSAPTSEVSVEELPSVTAKGRSAALPQASAGEPDLSSWTLQHRILGSFCAPRTN